MEGDSPSLPPFGLGAKIHRPATTTRDKEKELKTGWRSEATLLLLLLLFPIIIGSFFLFLGDDPPPPLLLLLRKKKRFSPGCVSFLRLFSVVVVSPKRICILPPESAAACSLFSFGSAQNRQSLALESREVRGDKIVRSCRHGSRPPTAL